MIRRRHPAKDGVAGLELVILLAVFISVTTVLLVHFGGLAMSLSRIRTIAFSIQPVMNRG